MDKKSLPYLVFIVAVLAIGGGYYYSNKDNQVENNPAGNQNTTTYNAISDACTKFTLEDAKKVIGSSAKSDSSVSPGVSADDANVTTCTYSVSGGADSSTKLQTASLLIRSPKTAAGVVSNQAPFNEAKPVSAENVGNLGDAAYWNAELAQLNVLVKDNWLIITAGPVKPVDRNQDQAVQAANLIIPKI